MKQELQIEKVKDLLLLLDAPKILLNERGALTLLALAGLKPGISFSGAQKILIGVTPIIAWLSKNYGVEYAPNTRETIRDEALKVLELSGYIARNPDEPSRPVNSPKTVYQLTEEFFGLLSSLDADDSKEQIQLFKKTHIGLAKKYAMPRDLARVSVQFANGDYSLSPGEHSELVKVIIEEFATRFVKNPLIAYVGDTENKWKNADVAFLKEIGIEYGAHIQMPDVVVYDRERNWLILIESVTSNGPMDGRRIEELKGIFNQSPYGLVFVTAFPDRVTFRKFVAVIAWETEVWIAESPTHMIHFNGERFLGPYN